MRIRCSRCGRSAEVPSEPGAVNDNEDSLTFEPPEGFRKVVMGPQATTVYLYCVACGAPAELDRVT